MISNRMKWMAGNLKRWASGAGKIGEMNRFGWDKRKEPPEKEYQKKVKQNREEEKQRRKEKSQNEEK